MCKLQVETFERRTKKNYVWIKKGIITQKIKLDCNSRFGISHSIMVSENCKKLDFFSHLFNVTKVSFIFLNTVK